MSTILTPIKLNFFEKLSDFLMAVLYASFTILNMDVSGALIMIFIIFVIIIVHGASKGFGNLNIGLFSGYIALFTLFSFASSFWAINADYAIEKTITLFSILICFSILYMIYYDANVERLIKMIMYGGLIVAYYSIFFYGLSNIQDTLSSESRLDTVFANVNVIGSVCGISVILSLYYYRKNKNRLLLLLSIPAVIVVAGTGSKKALILLIVGLVYVQFLHSSKQGSQKNLKIIGALISLSLIILTLVKSGIFSGTIMRMDGLIASFTGEGEVDTSTALRSLYRALGYAQFLETPILGIGMGNARILTYNVTGHDCYLHDNFAEMAANGGIVGFILYYWIYYYILKKEYKYRKIDSLSSIIIFIVIINLVMDYGGVSYYNKGTYFLLMVEMLHINKLKSYE